MEGIEHDKTFLYRYKIIVINLLLMAIIVGVDPNLLLKLPDTDAANYYIGVFILFALFLEFAGIWYKAQFLFSFSGSLYRKVPAYIGFAFLPRVIMSGIVATLAVDAMGGFKISEFFLIPIVLYAAVKEFWVRSVLLNTERERVPRPSTFRIAAGEIMLFAFMVTSYFAIWKVYFLDAPRIMFMVMSPINWGFAALAMVVMLYAFQMPYFWEDHLKPKTTAQKRLAMLSLLLPALGLLLRFFLQSYLRA